MEWKHAGSPRTTSLSRVPSRYLWQPYSGKRRSGTRGLLASVYANEWGNTILLLWGCENPSKRCARANFVVEVVCDRVTFPYTQAKLLCTLCAVGDSTATISTVYPGLAPSQYFLFPKLKKELQYQRCDYDNELTLVVVVFCTERGLDLEREGIGAVEHLWAQQASRRYKDIINTIHIVKKTYNYMNENKMLYVIDSDTFFILSKSVKNVFTVKFETPD